MAKLVFLVATLAIILLAVDASVYRTIITTTEIREDNMRLGQQQGEQQQQQQQCAQQVQRQDLALCEQFLNQDHQQQLRLRSKGGNQQQAEELGQCCQQLSQIRDHGCRCAALSQIVRYQVEMQQDEGEIKRQPVEQLRKMAEQLPVMCQVGQACEIGIQGLSF